MKVRSRYLLLLALAWGPCLLAAAAAYAAVLRPQWDCRKELDRKLTRGREEYAQALLAAKEEKGSPLAEEVERLYQRAGDFVVPMEEAPDLAFEISTLANEGRLESFAMKPAGKTGPNGPADLERVTAKHVDLSFSAPFPRFAAFLNALERHRPILFVETFTISRPAGEQDKPPRASVELALLMVKTAGPTPQSQRGLAR
jgi:hypothetical protein